MIFFKKNLKISIRIKALLTIIALELFLVGTFFVLSVKQYHSMMETEMKNKYFWLSKTLTVSLAMALSENKIEQVEHLLNQTMLDKDALYMIIRDTKGEVLLAKQKPGLNRYDATMSVFLPPLQFEIIEVGDIPEDLFHTAGHILEVRAPIKTEAQNMGWLQAGISTERINQTVANATFWGIRIMLILLVLGALVVALIDRTVKRNLARLIKTSQQMATGYFPQPVEIKRGDSLEELGISFNKMADALVARDAQIHKHQQHLEETVAFRTKQLRAEKAKLKAILDHVPSGFLLLDKDKRVEIASANYEEITGRKVEDLVGKCCTLSLWNDQICETCVTENCLKAKEFTTSTAKIEKEPGVFKYFERIAIPIKNGRQVQYILEIITDITQRQLMQERMIRAEKLAATGEMAAVIAHEMRNSLTSVNMILQLLNETAKEKNLDSESIQVALNSIKRSENVVNQLLQFSRPNLLQKHSSDLNQIVLECIKMTQPQFQRHGLKIEADLQSQIPLLEVDAERIKEALINLLLNADQSMEDFGVVTVKTRTKNLSVSLSEISSLNVNQSFARKNSNDNSYHEILLPKGAKVCFIEVSDMGRGIKKENIERILDPFFTTKLNGTGLGLPLVKRIVNEHGGLVQIESRVGKGSTFRLILPLNHHA